MFELDDYEISIDNPLVEHRLQIDFFWSGLQISKLNEARRSQICSLRRMAKLIQVILEEDVLSKRRLWVSQFNTGCGFFLVRISCFKDSRQFCEISARKTKTLKLIFLKLHYTPGISCRTVKTVAFPLLCFSIGRRFSRTTASVVSKY